MNRKHHPLTKSKEKLAELRSKGLCANCEVNPRHNRSYCVECTRKKRKKWEATDENGRLRINRKTSNINASAKARYGTNDTVTVERVSELLEISNCPYCAIMLDWDNRVFDHIVPMSKDGTNTDDNIQALCNRCNYAKSDMSDKEFKEWVRRVFKNLG